MRCRTPRGRGHGSPSPLRRRRRVPVAANGLRERAGNPGRGPSGTRGPAAATWCRAGLDRHGGSGRPVGGDARGERLTENDVDVERGRRRARVRVAPRAAEHPARGAALPASCRCRRRPHRLLDVARRTATRRTTLSGPEGAGPSAHPGCHSTDQRVSMRDAPAGRRARAGPGSAAPRPPARAGHRVRPPRWSRARVKRAASSGRPSLSAQNSMVSVMTATRTAAETRMS